MYCSKHFKLSFNSCVSPADRSSNCSSWGMIKTGTRHYSSGTRRRSCDAGPVDHLKTFSVTLSDRYRTDSLQETNWWMKSSKISSINPLIKQIKHFLLKKELVLLSLEHGICSSQVISYTSNEQVDERRCQTFEWATADLKNPGLIPPGPFVASAATSAVLVCVPRTPVHRADDLLSLPMPDWQHIIKNGDLHTHTHIHTVLLIQTHMHPPQNIHRHTHTHTLPLPFAFCKWWKTVLV